MGWNCVSIPKLQRLYRSPYNVRNRRMLNPAWCLHCRKCFDSCVVWKECVHFSMFYHIQPGVCLQDILCLCQNINAEQNTFSTKIFSPCGVQRMNLIPFATDLSNQVSSAVVLSHLLKVVVRIKPHIDRAMQPSVRTLMWRLCKQNDDIGHHRTQNYMP